MKRLGKYKNSKKLVNILLDLDKEILIKHPTGEIQFVPKKGITQEVIK